MCVEAYQGHTLSMLCAMPTVFVYCLTAFPSAKEQQFMCLIIQLTGHYFRGMAMIMTVGSVQLVVVLRPSMPSLEVGRALFQGGPRDKNSLHRT